MSHPHASHVAVPTLTIGLDLGDRKSHYCSVDASGAIVESGTVVTSAAALRAVFASHPDARVVLEVSTHSPWIARLLESLGCEVLVANPSAMYGPRRRRKRNDRMDAEFLARQGRADPTLLHPVRHRSERAQQQLEMLRARDQLVRARTQLINHVRGSVKSAGARIPRVSAEAFPLSAREHLPQPLRAVLLPLLQTIAQLTQRIRKYDTRITQIITQEYPDAQRLQQISGVGPITALAFVLLIDDPTRFRHSRQVGAYLGLVPCLDESSTSTPQLRITKTGDPLARRLLVSAAQYILGPFGPDCDLRRFGEALMVRGGGNAKKRAVIAVARKLAVLLHHLWQQQTTYDPHHQAKRSA